MKPAWTVTQLPRGHHFHDRPDLVDLTDAARHTVSHVATGIIEFSFQPHRPNRVVRAVLARVAPIGAIETVATIERRRRIEQPRRRLRSAHRA